MEGCISFIIISFLCCCPCICKIMQLFISEYSNITYSLYTLLQLDSIRCTSDTDFVYFCRTSLFLKWIWQSIIIKIKLCIVTGICCLPLLSNCCRWKVLWLLFVLLDILVKHLSINVMTSKRDTLILTLFLQI